MLDQVAHALAQHLPPLDLTSVRIDGRSSLQQRRSALNQFNLEDNCVIMLATIGAVGEG